MKQISTHLLKQIVLLVLIAFFGIVIIWKLNYFIPGLLGAITLYIMLRTWFFKLVFQKRWKKSWAALLIIIGCVLTLILPTWLIVEILIPKFEILFNNSEEIKQKALEVVDFVKEKFPQLKINQEQVGTALQKVAVVIPKVLDGVANLFTNIVVALFILYFMFMSSDYLEKTIRNSMPLQRQNRGALWSETKNLVISNAVGIPLLALAQGLVAMVGYMVAGTGQAVVLGLFTGLASIIPVVGTMIIWVPICIYLCAIGKVTAGILLAIYCLIVVGFSDNILRFTILKKFGDVHPLITVFGVILGLNIFGMMGLIFGPLMLSYFLIMIKIYNSEYGGEKNIEPDVSE